MNAQTLRNTLTAYILRLLPNPFGRYRRRYRFYQKIKNCDLVLSRKIRHSGVTLPLNLGDWIQYWMFMEGVYEKPLADYLRPHVSGRIFFDVGANIGSYTLSLARAAERIYSFEASPRNAATLNNFVQIAGLQNIDVINKGVSNRSGEQITIYSSPDTGGNNTQFHNFGNGCETVATITLDQAVAEYQIPRVDVIKMDIEGSELAAFQGADEILSRHRPLLLIEFHALVAQQAGWELATLYNLLTGYGYRVFELSGKMLAPFDQKRFSEPEFYANLIFIHPENGTLPKAGRSA